MSFTIDDIEKHQLQHHGEVRCTCHGEPHADTCPRSLIQQRPGFLPREVIAAAAGAEKQGRKMNRTEAEYQAMLRAQYPEAEIKYEAYTLKLANGVRYTPDFAVCHRDRTVDFHEVKGRFIFSRALVKPRVAATTFPHHRFFLAQKIAGSWTVTEDPQR